MNHPTRLGTVRYPENPQSQSPCVMVVGGWNRTNDSIEATAVISYCLGVPLSVLPTELHQHGWGLIVDEPTLVSIPMRLGIPSIPKTLQTSKGG